MSKQSEALAKAFSELANGFASLADAVMIGEVTAKSTDEVSIHQAVKEQKEVTAARAGRSTNATETKQLAAVAAKKPAKKAEALDPAIAKARKALDALDLDEATRPELKEIADALGIETQGKRASELRDALKPLKGGTKAKSADAEEVEPDEDEVTYPTKSVMRKELKQFCSVNKDDIEGAIPEFFDEDEDAEDPKERLHQILADDSLLKEFWKDNVFELKKAGSWEAVAAEAAEAVN